MTGRIGRIILVVVVAIVLVLCIAAMVTYWMVGPTPRCALPAEGPSGPGWSARTLDSGGRERCYHLYVPPGYNPAQPAPVVVSFHGFLSNPNSHALISGWHKLAEQEGFLVAYPQGTSFPLRWDAGSTWGAPGVNDVQFFRDMVDDMANVAAVDRSRVYVNGFSNGGGMAVRIGCEAAGEVAALGSVAGAVVEIEECSPSRPVPVMAYHGTADPVVPYEGGEMQGWLLRWGAGAVDAPVYFVGAEDWVSLWAAGNGCDPTPDVVPAQGDASGIRYTGCDQDAEVSLYTIDGGGHTWPGGWPIPAVGKTSTDINATGEMWQFFQRYQLEEQP
nr:esterase/lipase [uncultured bacterium]